jgi:hypothetical protein
LPGALGHHVAALKRAAWAPGRAGQQSIHARLSSGTRVHFLETTSWLPSNASPVAC